MFKIIAIFYIQINVKKIAFGNKKHTKSRNTSPYYSKFMLLYLKFISSKYASLYMYDIKQFYTTRILI